MKLARGGLMELEYILAADNLNEGKLDLRQALQTQRQALEAHRLLGSTWQDTNPQLAAHFAASQEDVRAATITLLGEPASYPSVDEHEETAVVWSPP